MPKLSAGIMLYRQGDHGVEILLVHPGGPFWAKKDIGAWSIPKGEYEEGDDVFAAAKREFREETGFDAPAGEPAELGQVKYSNKILTAWSLAGSVDARRVKSNMFTMEWPPKTGRKQEFAEVDRAGWFPPAIAKQKLVKGQVELVDRLCEQLDVSADEAENQSQMTLL
ncbi:MAG TPA: NUDIX domain-containing protein [Candidatus Saccharimonadales bacterium]|nr:NUDIX domain-containing protein [Candidatus Saccharimonadales bacterium]